MEAASNIFHPHTAPGYWEEQLIMAEAADLHRAFFILWDCIRFAREGADTLEEQIARQQMHGALLKALGRSRSQGLEVRNGA